MSHTVISETGDSSMISLISLKKRLLSGGVWAFMGIALAGLSTLAVNTLLARILAPDALGTYFLIFSLALFLALVAQLGLNQAVVRLVAESMGAGRPGRAAKAVRLVFRYGTVGALGVAVLLMVGAGEWVTLTVFDSPVMAGVVGLIAAWTIVLAYQKLLGESFRGFHDIRMASLAGGLTTSLLSATIFTALWLIKGQASLEQVLILILTATAINVLIAGLLMLRRIKLLKSQASLSSKDIYNIAMPLWITGLTFFAVTQADLWILGIFRSQEEVALYGAVIFLVKLVAMPLIVINAVLPPVIAEMFSQGKKQELEHVLRTTATLAAAPTFLVLTIFILFGEPILGLLYGDYYRLGATVLILLSFGQLVNVWAGSCGITLMMTGHQSTMMTITACSGLVTILLGIVLVQSHGVVGLASAAAIGLALQNMFMWIGVKLKTNMWTHVNVRQLPQYVAIVGWNK